MQLTPQQEERARRLHEESVILLAHDHIHPPADLEALRRGNVAGKILMAVVDVRLWSPDPDDSQRSITELDGWFDHSHGVYRDILQEMKAHPELCLIRCAEDAVRAKRDGRVGVLLGAEGGKL